MGRVVGGSYSPVMVNHADKPELHVDTVEDWEAWLNADPDPGGVRLRLRKKATTQPGITYAEALDVALCFGWIDGQSQSLDADYFLQTFTPRRPRSMWSKVNIGHVARLIEEGRMRPQGQHEIDRLSATLDGYHAYHAARADLLRRVGRSDESRTSYDRAIQLAGNPAERAYLARRRDQLVW